MTIAAWEWNQAVLWWLAKTTTNGHSNLQIRPKPDDDSRPRWRHVWVDVGLYGARDQDRPVRRVGMSQVPSWVTWCDQRVRRTTDSTLARESFRSQSWDLFSEARWAKRKDDFDKQYQNKTYENKWALTHRWWFSFRVASIFSPRPPAANLLTCRPPDLFRSTVCFVTNLTRWTNNLLK